MWNTPFYRLLGGPTRQRIRVYHTAQAKKLPPGGPYEHSGTPADIERIVAAVRAVRRQVGPGGAVMLDAHCAIPPAMLIQLAGALKPYDLLFLEEPAVPGNIEVFRRLKEKIAIPLAAGERDQTIYEFLPYLEHRCLDILQPDCCHTGGITSMKKVAVLAEAYQVPLAPHCTAGFLGISASLHVAASVPLFLIHEFYPDIGGFGGVVRTDWKLDPEGYIGLPAGPGLGVEVDEKKLEAEAKKPQSYNLQGATLKDGSVSDYQGVGTSTGRCSRKYANCLRAAVSSSSSSASHRPSAVGLLARVERLAMSWPKRISGQALLNSARMASSSWRTGAVMAGGLLRSAGRSRGL